MDLESRREFLSKDIRSLPDEIQASSDEEEYIEFSNFDYNYIGVIELITLSARKEYLQEFLKSLLDIKVQNSDGDQEDEGNLPFICLICGLRYEFLSELEGHISRDTSHLIFRCQICLLSFETTNLCQVGFHATDYHINEVGDYPSQIPIELIAAGAVGEKITVKEVCPECRKGVSSLVGHLWTSDTEGISLQCPYCNIFITDNACRYNLHIKAHKNISPYRCPDCAKCFKSIAELHIHLNEICRHLEQYIRYKCPVCSQVFRTITTLQKHVFTDHNPNKYHCHLCKAVLNIASEKNIHYEEHHQVELSVTALRRSKTYITSHICAFCGEWNLKGFSYERHIRKHIFGPGIKLTVFMCNCGFITMYKGTYLTHKSTPCLTKELGSVTKSLAPLKKCTECSDIKFYNGREPFICESCEHSEKNKKSVYKCSLCSMYIKYSMDYVITHLGFIHGKHAEEFPYKYVCKIWENNITKLRERTFLAKICGSKKTKEVMNAKAKEENKQIHARNISEESNTIEKINSHKCRKCPSSFMKMDYLRSHYIANHRESSSAFHCLECGEAYNTSTSFSIHLGTHGIADTEAYIKKYNVNDNLRSENSNKQIGTTGLLCPVCKEKFKNSDEQYRHLRSHGMAFLKRIKHH